MLKSIMGANLLFVITLLSYSCEKEKIKATHPVTDQQSVRLKEIVVLNSPTPYFHFGYNNASYIANLSYSSGRHVYNYFYEKGRIDSVSSSSADASYLLYQYNGQQVKSVQQYDATGLKKTVLITYDNLNRVIKMEWRAISSAVVEKLVEFQYYDNGNLSQMKKIYPGSRVTSTTLYQAYDTKRNVDAFSIFQDFAEQVILLPAVRFQYNNPTKMEVTSGANERIIEHTYLYNDSLPVERNSVTRVTAGPSAGQIFTGKTVFSYYE